MRAVNLTYSGGSAHFDVEFQEDETAIRGLRLPMTGDHNVSNVLSAIAVARHLGVKEAEIKSALENFKGVNRRFTKVGEVDGVTIIDDYGHHPVEIAAVLKAARQASDGRVIAVHQPHRYTRLHSLFEDFCTCFNEADVVAIAEVFAAGEDPIEGASRDDLVAGLIRHGHRHASALLNEDDLETFGAHPRAIGRYRRLPWRRYNFRMGQCIARPVGEITVVLCISPIVRLAMRRPPPWAAHSRHPRSACELIQS